MTAFLSEACHQVEMPEAARDRAAFLFEKYL